MTPPLLNYTPYSFNRSTNRPSNNSCEPRPPTCVESEPAVLNDDSLQLCYVVPMQTCIEEIRQIPGMNLFRDFSQLEQRSRQNAPQERPSAPPAGLPGNQGSAQQPAASHQTSCEANSNAGGFWSDIQDFYSFSWWSDATPGQRVLGVGIAVISAGGVGAMAGLAAASSAFGAGCACPVDHGDARADARGDVHTDARGDGHSDALVDGHSDARLDAASHLDATADVRPDARPDVRADVPADRPRG